MKYATYTGINEMYNAADALVREYKEVKIYVEVMLKLKNIIFKLYTELGMLISTRKLKFSSTHSKSAFTTFPLQISMFLRQGRNVDISCSHV